MPPGGRRSWPAIWPVGAAWAVLGCVRPAAAAGGDGTWWSYEYEYFHFECYVVIVLVMLAMLVDSVHHRLSHLAKGARAWRGDKADAKREVHRESQVSLWESLFGESVGELMVLGCVAVVVWSASRAGLFDSIATALSGYVTIALPGDSGGYLHTVEDVHMQLFATMMLYIGMMALTVRGTMHAEMQWEAADDRLASERTWDSWDSTPSLAEKTAVPEVAKAVLDDFSRRRTCFFNSLEDWRGRWLQMDQELEPVFATLPEAQVNIVSPTALGMCKESAEQPEQPKHSVTTSSTAGNLRVPVHDLMDEWFPFDEYLALECRFLVLNLAEVKTMTWVFISFSMFLKAQLMRETRTEIASYGFDVLMMLVLILFAAVSGWQIRRSYRTRQGQGKGLQRHRSRKPSKQTSKIWKNAFLQAMDSADMHISYPWLTALNLLQIVLFYVNFHIVRFTTLRQWWEEALVRSILCATIVLLGTPCLGFALGKVIPWLSLILARADFMQERHLKWIRVLLEDHCTGRDVAYNPTGRRISVNIQRGLSSPLFEAAVAERRMSLGLPERRVSKTALGLDLPERRISKVSLDRLDVPTVMAARMAAAEERRIEQEQTLGREDVEVLSPQDLPGFVSDD